MAAHKRLSTKVHRVSVYVYNVPMKVPIRQITVANTTKFQKVWREDGVWVFVILAYKMRENMAHGITLDSKFHLLVIIRTAMQNYGLGMAQCGKMTQLDVDVTNSQPTLNNPFIKGRWGSPSAVR